MTKCPDSTRTLTPALIFLFLSQMRIGTWKMLGGVVTGLIAAGSHTTGPHITWAACMVGVVLQVDLLTGV